MSHPARYITQFDSTTSLLFALKNALNQKAFKGAGVVPGAFGMVPAMLNHLPFRMRQGIYRLSGGWCAVNPNQLSNICAEDMSEWTVRGYPKREYPAMLIGSSNGAAMHLAAAMGIPWLPQTYLVAARRRMPADEIDGDIEWGRPHARVIRDRNPELRVQQMHDPVQDRLMIAKMAYFRLKRRTLGAVYERFIRENLKPGGTLILLEDKLTWPLYEAGDQHTFQVGGMGALDPQEYLNGSARVKDFLKKHGSTRKSWPLPTPVIDGPESEWGFYDSLGEDAFRFAADNHFGIQRIVYDEPEALSGPTADFYRHWYAENDLPADRLLIECFALIEPWMTLRTGCVPFWMVFNTDPSRIAVETYLRTVPRFKRMRLILMSNGEPGIGQVPIEAWKHLLTRQGRKGELLGTNEKKYPLDFDSFTGYHRELKKMVTDRALPAPAEWSEVDNFLSGPAYREHVRVFSQEIHSHEKKFIQF